MSYGCASCGFRTGKWMGFCPRCHESGALVEMGSSAAPPSPRRLSDLEAGSAATRLRGVPELDRVLGGGVVPGAVVLLAGEPGVGKSTLLLQAADAVAAAGNQVLLVSAEESVEQIGLRAARLGLGASPVAALAERDVDLVGAVARRARPDVLVVDSIQTLAAPDVAGSAGSAAQVRECTARLCSLARDAGIAVVLVGHVTKDGSIAGPKLVEHAVDVVLYLEGDPRLDLRVVRSLKNRFGATHDVGLFAMGERGLEAVPDPSRALLGDWSGTVAGTVAFPGVEGHRPVLVEVQALVAAPGGPQRRRSARGFDPARVHQLLAVLERHAGLRFGDRDVYVTVSGGLRIREPGADLPLALAMASSLTGRPLGSLAAWGEVGLTGGVRSVARAEQRAEEARRIGIERTISGGAAALDRIEAVLAEVGIPAAA